MIVQIKVSKYILTVQINIFKREWDKDFSAGKWDFLDKRPIERSRHALIGTYIDCLLPNAKILDVGCGLGTLTDFLSQNLKLNYKGIDISEIAINKARKLRKANFNKIAFQNFPTDQKFDVIIFNEVLYYMNYNASFKHALKLLNEDGLVVISIYNLKGMGFSDLAIWENSRKFFVPIESSEIKGVVNDGREVTWRIEVLKRKK